MGMIRCEDIIGKSYFDSYSEFYLACCMARECLRRGIQFDMSSMRIDKDILPYHEVEYFKCLWRDGAIYLGEEYSGAMLNESELYMDTTCFGPLFDVLFDNQPKRYYWSIDWLSEAYTAYSSELQNLSKLGNILMHLVAHMLICFYLGDREKKPIEIEITGQYVASTYIYVNLISCYKTLDVVSDNVKLLIDFSNYNVDIDYSIFYNNGLAAKRNKLWSVIDKRKFLDKCGFRDGMVGVLWERKGMCETNPAGRIINSTLIRIDEITDTAIAVYTLPVNKTKEEKLDDYNSIPEDRRYLFTDMLYNNPKGRNRMLSLYDVGVDNYFLSESEFITLLDTKDKVTKKITVDGKVSTVEMSSVDAIYWLLCQYEIDFDRELYRVMYNNGEPMLWDKYAEI